MNLNDYQNKSKNNIYYKNLNDSDISDYLLLGLAGETGEILEHFKLSLLEDSGDLTTKRIKSIKGDLGDILWYVARIAERLDLSLEDIAEGNLKKVARLKNSN